MATAKRRIETYERLIAEAETRESPEAAVKQVDPTADDEVRKRPKVPMEVYRRQLAAARAEVQLAEGELEELGGQAEASGKRNTVHFELVPLSKDVADDPTVKTEVSEHRKQWPDLTPGH
jgi:hypothetical protein